MTPPVGHNVDACKAEVSNGLDKHNSCVGDFINSFICFILSYPSSRYVPKTDVLGCGTYRIRLNCIVLHLCFCYFSCISEGREHLLILKMAIMYKFSTRGPGTLLTNLYQGSSRQERPQS